MPPVKRFQREDIIKVCMELVKNEGINSINARRIAKELNSSVQPIFHNFDSMDDLKEEVCKEIYAKYKEYMLSGIGGEKVYKSMGMSYIKFAKDYPEYFKILFMQKTNLSVEDFMLADEIGDDIIKAGQVLTKLSFEEQKKFHIKVWIFTHGIACLVATNTVRFSEDEISLLLETTVREMIKGYK